MLIAVLPRTPKAEANNGARNDTTQQSGQTPNKEGEIKKHYCLCQRLQPIRLECCLPRLSWLQQSEFVSSRQSGQIPVAVLIAFECWCNGQTLSNRSLDRHVLL